VANSSYSSSSRPARRASTTVCVVVALVGLLHRSSFHVTCAPSRALKPQRGHFWGVRSIDRPFLLSPLFTAKKKKTKRRRRRRGPTAGRTSLRLPRDVEASQRTPNVKTAARFFVRRPLEGTECSPPISHTPMRFTRANVVILEDDDHDGGGEGEGDPHIPFWARAIALARPVSVDGAAATASARVLNWARRAWVASRRWGPRNASLVWR